VRRLYIIYGVIAASTYETINWIAVGSGLRPIVISPVTNNILITIIGMFFGNQITKR
jgi:hypothetical protein